MIENYHIDDLGVIHQQSYKQYNYNEDYIKNNYVFLKYKKELSYLRLGYILDKLDYVPNKLLDVGYGSGDFLQVASTVVNNCYGNDLYDDFIPSTAKFVKDITIDSYDIITFFDSLEHFPSLDFLSELKSKNICISVPWCHNFSDDWFSNWKHRKPDEHIHHFNNTSLSLTMKSVGYKMIHHGNLEDLVRKHDNNYPNILTAIFQKI